MGYFKNKTGRIVLSVVRVLNSQSRGPMVQNHCLALRLSQPLILPRSIKGVPGPLGDLVVKSKLSPLSCSVALRQLNPVHKKGP